MCNELGPNVQNMQAVLLAYDWCFHVCLKMKGKTRMKSENNSLRVSRLSIR